MNDIQHLSKTWQWDFNCALDVGAHTGATAHTIRAAFADAQIHCFEPHPITFEILSRNVARLENVFTHQVAMSSQSGSAIMHQYDIPAINSLSSQANYAIRTGAEVKAVINIQSTTVDRFCADTSLERVDLLKVDVEGHDIEVLKGARSMMEQRAIKFVFIEFNDVNGNQSLSSIDELLRPFGFRFVATYNDYIAGPGFLDYIADGAEFFAVNNALFVLPPPAH